MSDRQAGNRQDPSRQGAGAWARLHTHALVALARHVWHEDCTLDDALALICETAAETLEVERVNVWRLHPGRGLLRCVHAYVRSTAAHNPPGYDEAFDSDSEYGRRLDDVRIIDAVDVLRDATMSASHAALGDYLGRHRIRSLLDAPVRSEGELLGVVCHEHVGGPRAWTPQDEAFAASIGDYVAMAYEISRRRTAEQRLRYLERHDPHTDLPNRDHLLEVAHSALRPMHGGDLGLAAIHLQIDAGTDENAGDALVGIAAALRREFGETVTLARVRDDAFALLPYRHLHETEALNLAERCIDLVQTGGRGDGAMHAVAAAGIAFSRDLAAPSADALLRNAELAAARARTVGALNRCEIFDAEHHRGLLARLRTERALRDAFEQDALCVHFQPEVDLRDGRWHAAEALLRWREGDGRIRPASEFIGVAEGSGLIVTLGRWVLRETCRLARGWPAHDGIAPGLSVNVSARQFEQAGLVADVAQALSDSGLAPARLCLELDRDRAAGRHRRRRHARAAARARRAHRARRLRHRLFSLGYLKRLPIDALKLDRSFVAGLPHDRRDLAIVRAVAGLARETGIEVVAEGVENELQAAARRDCGIHRAQGYLYAPALDAETLQARFEAHS